MNDKKRLLVINCILLIVIALLLWKVNKKDVLPIFSEQKIIFSEEAGFYEGPLQVRLSLEHDVKGTIHYTLDGREPGREDPVYESPLEIPGSENTQKAAVLRARGFDENGDQTEVYTRTYFVGAGLGDRFDVPVVSVVSDPYNLFDYEYGILIEGKLREDFAKAYPEVELSSKYPANYNLSGKEAERPAYVEVFAQDGRCLFGQNLGIRTSGGTTRSYEQKSLRLYARSSYGNNTMEIAFFEEEPRNVFRRILLRNSGNDYVNAYIRDDAAQELAREAGFPDTQMSRPAAVFLNGEYYGLEWIKEVYDETYFHENYKTDPLEGTWQVVELKDGPAESQEDSKQGKEAAEEWNEIAALAGQDFNNEAVFAEFTEKVDLDNFLLYCATEIFFANPDWPINNCKVYRWYSNYNTYREGHADGKWRFLLYDLDNTFYLTEDSGPADHSIAQVMNLETGFWKRYFPLFTALMQREDMRREFRELMEELMEGPYSSDNMLAVIESTAQKRQKELEYHMALLDERGEVPLEEQLMILENSMGNMERFARERAENIRNELMELDF